jgi:hypothetical protein
MRILAGGATAIGLSANLGASIAWRASCGSAVETTSPPMMATAIGPQNTLRDGGIRDRHRRRQDGRLASAHRTLDHRTRAWRGLGAITPSGATVASSGTCRPQLHRPPSCARREGLGRWQFPRSTGQHMIWQANG